MESRKIMGIYKVKGRHKTTWYVDLRDPSGKRIRKAVGSKKDAEKIEAVIKADILRGEYRFKRNSKKKFSDFAKEYMKYSKANKRSWQRDQTSINALDRYFGQMLLSKINAGDIEKYKIERKDKVSPASLNRELACLSAVFREAKKAKIVDANPVREVKKFRERKLQLHILDGGEAQRLVDAADGHLKPIIIVALGTAMRRGEIFNLKWSDIDFGSGYITITESKSNRMRKVPLNSVVRRTLLGIRKESPWVFFNRRTGKPLTTIRKSFLSALDDAKIDASFRFHDLRHTSGTWMLKGGADLISVSQVMGHASIEMTARYLHSTSEDRKNAVDILGSNLADRGQEKAINWPYDQEGDPLSDLFSALYVGRTRDS
jgi:integrase